jgi:hypothetical protein
MYGTFFVSCNAMQCRHATSLQRLRSGVSACEGLLVFKVKSLADRHPPSFAPSPMRLIPWKRPQIRANLHIFHFGQPPSFPPVIYTAQVGLGTLKILAVLTHLVAQTGWFHHPPWVTLLTHTHPPSPFLPSPLFTLLTPLRLARPICFAFSLYLLLHRAMGPFQAHPSGTSQQGQNGPPSDGAWVRG